MTNPLTDCYCISTTHPYVLLWGYWNPRGYNEMLPNPGLIAEYTYALQDGCMNEGGLLSLRVRREHCTFLDHQVKYLSEHYLSPHKGLDIWPLPNNGRADGMAQVKIARMYYREWARSCGKDYSTCKNSYVTRALRAAKAFDWGWDNGGVAHAYDSLHYWYVHTRVNLSTADHYILNGHNHALIGLHDLMAEWRHYVTNPPPFPDPATPNPFTWADYGQFRVRRDRGLNTLRDDSLLPNPSWPRVRDFHHAADNRSYYRTSSNGDVPYKLMACDDNYHKQNWKTLGKLIDRGLDNAARTLWLYANMWKNYCR